jgi:hypothetical protein
MKGLFTILRRDEDELIMTFADVVEKIWEVGNQRIAIHPCDRKVAPKETFQEVVLRSLKS